MTEQPLIAAPAQLVSALRHGHMVLLMIDNSAGSATGVVAMAAELCEAEHITFMARKARGLVCLGITKARCEQLALPMMVEGSTADAASFTLSIEAAVGIDTGISAADRARTVRAAVLPDAKPSDLVQPGHIFPVAAAEGGVLMRADRAEATTDLVRLAGLLPAAVFTDVLNTAGDLARDDEVLAFAAAHELPVGRVSDLVHFRLANEHTVTRLREGQVATAHGPLQLTVYHEATQKQLHLALSRGDIRPDAPTLVRVHITSILRDLVGTELNGHQSWRFDDSLKAIAGAERGVLVLIHKPETSDDILASVDRLLGNTAMEASSNTYGYASIGLGAQILHDLGVGQINLLGPPVKYNALSGFGLEVVDFVSPEKN